MMSQARVISFHYTLTDNDGAELDSSRGDEPFHFLEGSQEILPNLESQLLKMNPGDKKKIILKAAEAYGERNTNLVVQVPKSDLPTTPEEIEVGDQFQSPTEEGGVAILTVTQIQGDQVTLDANHPLAGQDLTFDVELVGVRAATKEEMTHGHAHGPDGHHHH